MIDLTDTERREVALFIAAIWRAERERRRRQPTAEHVVAVAYATAMALVDAEVGNHFLYLGAPRPVRAALLVVSANAATVSRRLSDVAANVVAYLDQTGDSPTAKPESIAIDRRIVALAARDYHRNGTINDSEIGRKIGLSHTSVRDRRLARSARIMARLHGDMPSLWAARGRPVDGPKDATGRVWSTTTELQAAA